MKPKMVASGRSPAREKARDKARIKDAETFAWAEKWLRGYQMAESTRDMRRSVYQRELKSKFAQQKLSEITHEDLRALTDNIVERGHRRQLYTPERLYCKSIAGPLSAVRRWRIQLIWYGLQA